MKGFVDDWPTQALAMQLMRNKRGHSHHCGYLDVPTKWAYLKENLAKKKKRGSRNARVTPQLSVGGSEGEGEGDDKGTNKQSTDRSAITSGSRSRRADRPAVASGLRFKCAAPATTGAWEPALRKKQKVWNTRSTAKGKGKQKASSVEAEDEAEIEDKVETQDSDGAGSNIDEANINMVDPEE